MCSDRRPVAVVSGGSRGIGRAVVCRLAADGYDIALCYKACQDDAESSAKAARDAGSQVLVRQADVTDQAACRDLIAAAENELGGLDVVVTSAGIVVDNPLVLMDKDDWDRVLQTNLTGTFNVCRAAIFAMMKQRSGSIVTISSVAGVLGNAGQTNYAASKAGIIGFTKSLAKEVGRYGVRVNCVTPGFISTDMTSRVPDTMLSQIPLKRLGRPEDVANLVAFLASAQATYITAGVYPVDGGIWL